MDTGTAPEEVSAFSAEDMVAAGPTGQGVVVRRADGELAWRRISARIEAEVFAGQRRSGDVLKADQRREAIAAAIAVPVDKRVGTVLAQLQIAVPKGFVPP